MPQRWRHGCKSGSTRSEGLEERRLCPPGQRSCAAAVSCMRVAVMGAQRRTVRAPLFEQRSEASR